MSFTVFAASRPPMLRTAAPVFADPAPDPQGQVPPPSPAGPLATAASPSSSDATPPGGNGGGVTASQTAPDSPEGAIDTPLSNGSALAVARDTGGAPNATTVDQQQTVPGAPAAAAPDVPAADADSFIYTSEIEPDRAGNARQVTLPSQDTGGSTEIAGFTDKYDPQQLAQIAATPPAQRKDLILSLIDQKTAPAAAWSDEPAVQGLLRDTVFHRGDQGAQAIIHTALTGQLPVGQDGKPMKAYTLTPDEIQQIKVMHPLDAINAITQARRTYENAVYGVRPQLAKGLTNRFNNAQLHFTKLYLGDNS